MDVELIVDSRVSGRNYERLALDAESDVTDEPLVEDSIDGFALVVSTLGQSFERGAIRLRECHGGNSKSRREQTKCPTNFSLSGFAYKLAVVNARLASDIDKLKFAGHSIAIAQ